MKIRIKAADTEFASIYATSLSVFMAITVSPVMDYIDELRQQAQWNKLKAS